ncbi:mechanosensitive ion channel domain-containing protein [Promethearchaeum syntrophicum]|uniref:Mechanosensitive ion channel domain-containing protein n=1 Tax=Promethearchaeum syntrophicum TaxID=2594042 RepID=A0A5B9DDP0_9ARCH|nr:mechanosensitive ion channel domain-containing protein [Candidatus Prometheoarchaeum syntrophicum]
MENDFLWFLLAVVLIYSLYRIFMFIIKKILYKRKYPVNAVNVLKLLIRVFTIILYTIALIVIIEIPDEYLISLTSIGGIIIGFAATEIMSQIISGIYIITAKPFGVNDLIQLGDTEGIVLEIGMNYTVVQRIDGTLVKIPNKKILDSNVKDYTIEMKDELEKNEINKDTLEKIKEISKSTEKRKKSKISSLLSKDNKRNFKKLYKNFTELILEQEITRYTFKIQVYFDVKPEIMLRKLDLICKKYESIYKYKPLYSITNLSYRATIQFIITCPDALVIVDQQEKLIKDIVDILYQEEEII